MGRHFVSAGRDQLFLLPPDAREWLPAGHLAWAVLEATGGLDMRPFTSWYRSDGQGRPAFDPGLMVALVLYCYCKGVRSSRAIEMATWDDVGARVICGGLHPDHATIARFVSRHEGPLKGLLVASLAACARQGLVSVAVVAGDGTMIKAAASAASNATAADLDAQAAELEALLAAEVEGWLAAARAADEADAAAERDDPPGGPPGGAGTLAVIAGKIVRRQQARAVLAARDEASPAGAARSQRITRLQAQAARAGARAAQEEAACQARVADYQRRAAARSAAGSRKGPDGRVPVTAAESARVRAARAAERKARSGLAAAQAAQAAARAAPPGRASTTDPASRLMPAKKGGFDQLWNVQALAEGHQVILAIGTHDNPAGTGALHPLLQRGRASLDAAGITAPIGAALFDAGYASDANFTAPCQPQLYIAVTREARQAGRLRDGQAPASDQASWQAMTARLATPHGKALYKHRAAIIEPVFAQLFNRLGRSLHYRGTRVDLELHLWAASHNYLKAIRHQARPAQAA
jgi:transposase